MRLSLSIPLLVLVFACASKPVEGPVTPSGPEPVVFVEQPPEQVTPARPSQTQIDQSGSTEADRERAKQLFNQGATAFQNGDIMGARGYFEQAYNLAPLPELLFNIARCSELLGDVEVACRTYDRLGADPQADEHTRQVASERAAAFGC